MERRDVGVDLLDVPADDVERVLADALATVVERPCVSVHSDYFDDIGADSMTMAHFCATLDKHSSLPPISIKDVYQHRTIRSLAVAVADLTPTESEKTRQTTEMVSVSAPIATASSATKPVGTAGYVLCGVLQGLILLGLLLVAGAIVAGGYEWVSSASGWTDRYIRSATFGAATFVGLATVPIVVKWTLAGRWKHTEIRIWSLRYVRFWFVKLAVRANPLVLFAGSPIFVWYLRALGANIGRGTVILSPAVPVCTDLLAVGDRSVVRRDVAMATYRAVGSVIETGSVTIGSDAYVGEATTLDVGSSVGERAQLGHSSSLLAGQAIPDDEHRIGSPATTRTDTDFLAADRPRHNRRRRCTYSLAQVVILVAFKLPIGLLIPLFIAEHPVWTPALEGSELAPLTTRTFYVELMAIALVVFLAPVLVRLAIAMTIPRLLNRAIDTGTVYPIYTLRFGVHRTINRLTNLRFFTRLFGDSSYILGYLRRLGYDMSPRAQMGANFGTNVRHESPYHVRIGDGTMAADGLSIINSDYSSTSFAVGETTIGAQSFLGNDIAYPPQGRTGDNCLHATKVQIPVEGAMRHDVGLLGSPSFEIPRLVERDREFSDGKSSVGLTTSLAAKNRHNLVSMALFLLTRWIGVALTLLLVWLAAFSYATFGPVAIGVFAAAAAFVLPAYLILVERATMLFRPLRPTQCSLYVREGWMIERLWKLSWQPVLLNGTPAKAWVWRALGVRMGRQVFDDGCAIVDRTLTTVGDRCSLNARSTIQAHSQEDAGYKSDHVTLGSGVTLGVRALVHYGCVVGDDATLEADSFLMKGSVVPPRSRWGDNPARHLAGDDPWPLDPPIDAAVTTRHRAEGKTDTSERGSPMSIDIDVDRDYWHSVLRAGGRTVLPRWTSASSPGVAMYEVEVPRPLIDALRHLADDLNVSVVSIVIAAHAKVVAALSGEREIVTGFVAQNGAQPLPFRVSTEPTTWHDLILECHRIETEVRRHKDVRISEIVRDPGFDAPPFETVFDQFDPDRGLDDDTVLRVSVMETGRLRLHYRRDAFDAECIARTAGYHVASLTSLADDPSADHTSSRLLTPGEFERQLHGLDGPEKDLPDRRFHELFEQRVKIHPDAVAAVQGDQSVTYRELNARANQLARLLRSRRVRPTQVVAVVTERNLDWMTAVLAIFKAGAVYLPIEPHFPADRIARTLSRAGCTMVMTEPGSTGTLYEALHSLSGIEGFFIDTPDSAEFADTDLDLGIGADQVAYIYFTSGSTGEPKGAMCEQAGFLNHLYAKIDDFGIGEGDTVAQIAPQCFDISLWQLVAALLVGGRTLIIDQDTILDPPTFIDTISDEAVAVMQVVPSYLEVLLSYLDQDPRPLPALRCVSVTGEALSLELAQRWFASMPTVKLANAYGLTETSDDTNHEVMDRAPEHGSVPLGPAVNNVHVRVVDEHLAPVPLGAPGEIVFSGVCVGRGYVNDPVRTAAAFMNDPLRPGERLYRSGDFGRWRPDGKLEYLGRRDAQVKIRGFRIEIGEIENAMLRVRGVRHSAVVVQQRPDDSKQLVGFYSGERLASDELQTRLGASLPDYMVPPVIHWQDILPLTGNGKTDKKFLRALADELDAADRSDLVEPQTDIERSIAAAWAAVLGVDVDQIGRHDNFFDRGGSSLTAVEMLLSLDAEVSLADVTRCPVLADLAEAISGDPQEHSQILQLLVEADDDAAPVLICFPYAGGNAVNFHAVARSLEPSPLTVYAVEFPGHDLTSNREPFAPLSDVVDQVVTAVRSAGLDRVMLWGHSSGAAFAVESARRLLSTDIDVMHVFVGAQQVGTLDARLTHMGELASKTNAEIADTLVATSDYSELGALDPQRSERVGAAYRHDCVQAHAALSAVIAAPPETKLPIPMTTVVAADDPSTDGADGARSDWELLFERVDVEELSDGGHYFLRTRPERVADVLRARVHRTDARRDDASAPAPSPRPSAVPTVRVVSSTARPDTATPVSTVSSSASTVSSAAASTPGAAQAMVRVDVEPGKPPIAYADEPDDAAAWMSAHQADVQDVLAEHGSVLVRGLGLGGIADTSAVVRLLAGDLMLEREPFASREVHAHGIYSSTVWPPNQQMCMHHELSYTLEAPSLMFFACVVAPTHGGAVALADSATVLEALPSELVDRVESEGWMLVRNYTDEIGLSVEDVFGTSSNAEIETYCHSNGIEFEWRSNGGLRTWQRRPAVTRHPGTGRRCWFNQIAFLNEWTMKPEVRDFLVGLYGADGLPFTTRFGNGDPVGEDVVDLINGAYDANTIGTPWERGDLLLVDNIRMAHSREPYEGDRQVLVSLADPFRVAERPVDRFARAD